MRTHIAISILVLVLCLGRSAVPVQLAAQDSIPTGPASPSALVPLSGVSIVAAGDNHACALVQDGTVKCWGWNINLQLGNPIAQQSALPVTVAGLHASALAAGGQHTCAITAGAAKCWGQNSLGQLGTGAAGAPIYVPQPVAGLESGATAVTAGTAHTCALTEAGAVLCWGANHVGQLGNGTGEDSAVPMPVTGLDTGVVAITAGGAHTCALINDRGVKCWGYNEYGQLGHGTSTMSETVPVDVVDLYAKVESIAAGGYHTCARLEGGGVKCWGGNSFGELGDGTGERRYTPTAVVGLDAAAAALAAGRNHSCVTTLAGAARCWGYGLWGQIGNGTNVYSQTVPVTVAGINQDYRSLALGGFFSCGLTAGDNVRCWGQGAFGSLGDGGTEDRNYPADVVLTCYALARSHAGSGSIPAIAPPASPGCPASKYESGAVVTLTAAPDPGWVVWAWQGTANSESRALTATVTIGTSDVGVNVTYARPLFLPAIRRPPAGAGRLTP